MAQPGLVLQQSFNVCQTTMVQDAWARGQEIVVHGWVYGIQNGLINDLRMSVKSSDDVVPAGVADSGQRVIFGANADDQRTAAVLGPEGGVQTAGGRSDVEAPLGHERLGLGATAVLRESQFRLGVNRVRQCDQIGTVTRDGIGDRLQCVSRRHHGSIAPARSAAVGN